VMMAAMMLPALAPMVVEHGRRAAHAGAPALFAAGYLATWLAAGLVGYAGHRWRALAGPGLPGLGRGRPLRGGRGDRRRRPLPAERAEGRVPAPLPRARGVPARPLAPGRLGALRMGVEHGGWCVGCSWALMAALLALGVMSLTGWR
jgi:hypothetical protein